MMTLLPNRHAISRAKLFLDLAELCTITERDMHEAYLEAAIIFCRTAMHRLETRYEKEAGWNIWFKSLLSNSSVAFIRKERNFILKEAPPKVGQVIRLGTASNLAKDLYYYQDLRRITLRRLPDRSLSLDEPTCARVGWSSCVSPKNDDR